MRKYLLTGIIACFAVASQAQEATQTAFKRFKVDLATGYAVPSGQGSKGGVLFAVEPKYALNNMITLGLRLETAVTARAYVDESGESFSGDVKALGSYFATGDYYFNTKSFRPFAGLGFGIARVAGVGFDESDFDGQEVTFDDNEIQTSTKFGFKPRIGFEYGHFRTALEYNFIGKSKNINNNYMSLKLGFFLGGGRR